MITGVGRWVGSHHKRLTVQYSKVGCQVTLETLSGCMEKSLESRLDLIWTQ